MTVSTCGAFAASLDDCLGVATLGAGGDATCGPNGGGVGGGNTFGNCGTLGRAAVGELRGGGMDGFWGATRTARGAATIKPVLVTVVVSRGERLGCGCAGKSCGGLMGYGWTDSRVASAVAA